MLPPAAMDLTTLANGALLRKLENLTSFERSSLVLVLHCLREVEQRRLFSGSGYSSLFAYCVKRLRYPEDQAQRRIVAMRMMKELPEIEREIESGNLSLTVVGILDTHFHAENITDIEKRRQLISLVNGLSKRDAEKALAATTKKKRHQRPDRIRAVSESEIELRFVARTELETKISAVKDQWAHKHPKLSLGAMFELLCDPYLEKPNDSPPAPARVTPQQKAKRRARPGPPIPRPRRSRLHRQVFTRDSHKCSLCASTHALEVDHIIPRAKGGTDSLENLRLLCRSCNQREAIKHYGQEKMNQYL